MTTFILMNLKLELMNFEVHIKDEILELFFMGNLGHAVRDKVHGSEFTIRGANVGVTDLYVSITCVTICSVNLVGKELKCINNERVQ